MQAALHLTTPHQSLIPSPKPHPNHHPPQGRPAARGVACRNVHVCAVHLHVHRRRTDHRADRAVPHLVGHHPSDEHHPLDVSSGLLLSEAAASELLRDMSWSPEACINPGLRQTAALCGRRLLCACWIQHSLLVSFPLNHQNAPAFTETTSTHTPQKTNSKRQVGPCRRLPGQPHVDPHLAPLDPQPLPDVLCL